MNYLSSVFAIEELSSACFSTGEAPPPDASVNGPDEVHLLAALQQEADYAAAMVSVSASIANVLDNPSVRKGLSSDAMAVYSAAGGMPVFAHTAQQLLRDKKFSQAASSYLALNLRLSLARSMTAAYCDENRLADGQQSVEVHALQNAWRHASLAALRLRQDLTAVTPVGGGIAQQSNLSPAATRPLSRLLLAAANGGHPCIDVDGCISIPGWAERRCNIRHDVNFEVEIRCGRQAFRARAANLSADGVGIEDLTTEQSGGLAPGDPATICLPGNRRLRGAIAWVSGTQAGITLVQSLEADDPLWAYGPLQPIHR